MRSLLNLEYLTIVGYRPLLLDLFLPDAAEGAPLVVWIHGGGWQGGNKANSPAVGLMERGIAVAAIQYRLSEEVKFPKPLHDIQAAVRWLRANADTYGFDSRRVALWSSSAGGHLATLFATTADRPEMDGRQGDHLDQPLAVRAVVNWSGCIDGLAFARYSERGKEMVERFLGQPTEQCAELSRQANPITYVSASTPSMLIVHSTRDPLVPYASSQALAEALQGAGVEVTLHTQDGDLHGSALRELPEIIRLSEEFLVRQLTGVPVGA